MFRVSLLLFVAQVAFAAIALISCLSAEDDDVKALPRWGWILIILLFPLVGGIAWFVAGRRRTKPRTTWRSGGGFPERDRPLAPDDNPDFLRSLRPRPIEDEDDDDEKDR